MAGLVGGGGGLRGHGELPLNADINVTSLVDVAFVLLIIFMITAPIMQGGVGTVFVHAFVGVLFLVGAANARKPAPPTYRVHLVAAPAPTEDARKAPEAVERPAEEKPAPAPKAKSPKSTVAPAPPPPVADNTKREAAPRTTPKAQPLPGQRPSTGRGNEGGGADGRAVGRNRRAASCSLVRRPDGPPDRPGHLRGRSRRPHRHPVSTGRASRNRRPDGPRPGARLAAHYHGARYRLQ